MASCASPKLHPAEKLNSRLDILTVKSRLDRPTRASWKAMKTQADGILARHRYVRNRHRRPERNFEVVAGKALDRDGQAKGFAFVRSGGSEAVSAVGLTLRHCGV